MHKRGIGVGYIVTVEEKQSIMLVILIVFPN
jgi:hypothetical protein